MLALARAVAMLLCLSALAAVLNAQPRVDSRNSYERILVVLPLVGTGTLEDPIRPMFIAAAQAVDSTNRAGIIGFTYVVSDDGKHALTEIVVRNRVAVQQILNAPAIKTFIKGVSTRADIEAEFKKYKKDFDITKFGVNVQ